MLVLTNSQLKNSRITFVKEVIKTGIFTVPQARYEFDKFLMVQDTIPRIQESYVKVRRLGAANKMGKAERENIYSVFVSAVTESVF